MEDPRIQEAARKFTEAYESVVVEDARLNAAGLWKGAAAVLAMSAIYVAQVDEVPSLSTTPHEINEEITAEEVVNMWEALKRNYLLLRSVGGFDVKGLEAVLERLRMTEQRADQLQSRIDALEKGSFEAYHAGPALLASEHAKPARGVCAKMDALHDDCGHASWRPWQPDRARAELDLPCDYCGAVVGRGCDWGPEPHDAVFHLTRTARFLEEEKGK